MASPYWQRRNEQARALGYKNYYDYRQHGYGKVPPEQPRATGATARRLRGHASRASLRSALTGGNAELVIVTPTRRGDDGRFTQVSIDVTFSDGGEKTYWLDEWMLSDLYEDDLWDADFVLLDAYNVTGASE